MPECTATERSVLDAAIRGDQEAVDKAKAELAYERLPEDVKRDYRTALYALDEATLALNRVIERIPDFCRGKVIERMKREAELARREASHVSTANRRP